MDERRLAFRELLSEPMINRLTLTVVGAGDVVCYLVA